MDVIGAIDFLDLGGNRVLIIPTKGAPTVALLFACSRRSFSPQRSHTVTPFPLYFLSLLHARKNPIHSEMLDRNIPKMSSSRGRSVRHNKPPHVYSRKKSGDWKSSRSQKGILQIHHAIHNPIQTAQQIMVQPTMKGFFCEEIIKRWRIKFFFTCALP